MEVATFGGGCFWCTEAIFQRLKGVQTVTSGYSGGKRVSPTYAQVTSGATGHAEAVQISFDPQTITFNKLLQIFFATHDPTTKDRQGNDIGTQYRSIIFYHSEKQREEAEGMIRNFDSKGGYGDKIVTEIVPFEAFYDAEGYHQNYFNDNRDSNPYCSIVIDPKVKELLEKFNSDVKPEYK